MGWVGAHIVAVVLAALALGGGAWGHSDRQLGPVHHTSAEAIAQAQPADAWQRLSAGAGAKGERLYDWVLVPLWRLQLDEQERRWGHYLLVRRSLGEKGEHAYNMVHAQRDKASLANLVRVAGRRWEIEIGFDATKGECGLDHHEVCRWQGWYRHITLSLLAQAVLVALRVQAKKSLSGADRAQRTRAQAAAGKTAVARLARYAAHPALVCLAQATPSKPEQGRRVTRIIQRWQTNSAWWWGSAAGWTRR